MQNLSKLKIGISLLLGLIPAIVLGILSTTILGSEAPWSGGSANIFWSLVGSFTAFYFICAIIPGIVLTVLGLRERTQGFKEAQAYAQMHGWHPITKHIWRSRKRRDIQLGVDRATVGSGYILSIEVNGEVTVIDLFSRLVWALEFGEWLWQELDDSRTTTSGDVEAVAQRRGEWEQSRAITLYKPQIAVVQQDPRVTAPSPPEPAARPMPEASWRGPGSHYELGAPMGYEHGYGQPGYGYGAAVSTPKNRITAALLAWFLGAFGAHKFYLGHTGLGIAWIFITCTIIGAIFWTWPVSFIEFIIYLTKSDEDFDRIYVQGRKALF